MLFNACLHLLFHTGQLGFPGQDGAELFQARFHVQLFQDGLTVLHVSENVGRNHIRQLIRRLHFPHGVHGFSGDPLAGRGIGGKKVLGGAYQRLHLNAFFLRALRLGAHLSQQIRFLLGNGFQGRAAQALHQHP